MQKSILSRIKNIFKKKENTKSKDDKVTIDFNKAEPVNYFENHNEKTQIEKYNEKVQIGKQKGFKMEIPKEFTNLCPDLKITFREEDEEDPTQRALMLSTLSRFMKK